MQRLDEEQGDVFFDSYDNIRTSIDSPSSDESVTEHQELGLSTFNYELWTSELISVCERRTRFLQGMGLDELASQFACFQEDREVIISDRSAEKKGLGITRGCSDAAMDSSLPCDNIVVRDADRCIRDVDSGKRFIVQEFGQDGLFGMLKEVGSDKLLTLREFESVLGLSHSFQRFMKSAVAPVEENSRGFDGHKRKYRSWWRSFLAKRHRISICKYDVSVKDSTSATTARIKVQRHRKSFSEFTGLYTGQEIQAHKGAIRAMKFCPSGRYLASGGEDWVVRIWQVNEVEPSSKWFSTNESSKFIDKIRYRKLVPGSKVRNSVPIIIPKKIFKVEETPMQELHGHTSDILDLSWSNADCLLTSSKDKTVRMWKVGCDECLKVFEHNDYVTCVQFNPVDDGYYISGSIDGKVRIWGVSVNRVVDWADIRDMVTAVCYKPDGKGFVIGSITGNCRFYDYSDNYMQLGTQFCIQGGKRSAGKRITGLQFCPDDPKRIIITSADSKVRTFDGADVVHKFRGLRETKNQLSSSFASDGRYIVSVGEDSHVYIWNYNTSNSSSSKGVQSIRSCECFSSEGVSVAVPWPSLAVSRNINPYPSSPPLKMLEPSTWLKGADQCYLEPLFFADGLSRASATWPAEELSRSPRILSHADDHLCCHRDPCPRCLAPLSATWSLVFVTASCDGFIRSFHNYGLPVRL